MTGTRRAAIGTVAILLSALMLPAIRAEIHSGEKLTVYGDFRIRVEQDWDSQREDGSERDDRLRMRARVRFGLGYAMTEFLSFGLRIRTGPDDAQQSGHITVLNVASEDDTGDAHVNPDRWYVKARKEELWGWFGRNDLPFWKQNEMFWDSDVTVAGIGGGWKTDLGGGALALNGGYLSLPVGLQEFADTMVTAQAVYSREFGDAGLTAAFGVLDSDGADDDDSSDAAMLLDGNGFRDYTIFVASLQGRLAAAGRPLTLGLDLLHNTKNYSEDDPDPATAMNHDETDGYVISAAYGKLASPRDWQVAYVYARIETLAVHSSYAQDDWVRWGSQTQNRASNQKGHELRGARQLTKDINVVARLFLVDSITSGEDGKRVRVDMNFRF